MKIGKSSPLAFLCDIIQIVNENHNTMGAFGIFALILTTAYIIYYAVIITQDVLALKRKEKNSSTAEVLDTSFMDEQTVYVGATKHEEEPLTGEADIEDVVAEPCNDPGMNDWCKITADIDNSLVDVEVDYTDQLTPDEYFDGLSNNGVVSHRNLMIECQTINPDGTTEDNSVAVPIDEL